jgi:hypothetical protein
MHLHHVFLAPADSKWYNLAKMKELKIMTKSQISQLEAAVDELSLSEQLSLLERLVQRIRERALRRPTLNDDEFAQMARDPAIQRELQTIEKEFALADSDGLDDRS